MPHHWALFYFAQSGKNITNPERKASAAQTSAGPVCGYPQKEELLAAAFVGKACKGRKCPKPVRAGAALK
jgi:hypothetical protein